ncbi:hypothetical protein [Pseudomonas moorei]|uniref:hypothetical protein n=1 Tax=Pseudomonas moorei TaxID=395599 RepID=UPI0036F360F3
MVRAKNANENLMAQPQINELVAAMERAKKLPFYYRRKAIREMSGIATHETLINLPKWLVDGSNFHSNIWHVNFFGGSRYSFTIYFDIELSDGSLLTDEQHKDTLYWIKVFLVVQNHPRYNNQTRRSPHYEHRKFVSALQFVDWIILHDDVFDLASNRLSLVKLSDIKSYLITTIGTPKSDKVYKFPERLSKWLIENIDNLSELEFQEGLRLWPHLRNIPPLQDRILDLDDMQLLKARVWIKARKLFTLRSGNEYFNPSLFQQTSYKNTLYGRNLMFRAVEDLRMTDLPRREYPAVPISKPATDGTSLYEINHGLLIVKKICVVAAHYSNLGINPTGIAKIKPAELFGYVAKQKQYGRFSTLPHPLVIKLMGDCFQFYTDNAQAILSRVVSFFKSKDSRRYDCIGRQEAYDTTVSFQTTYHVTDNLNPITWIASDKYFDQAVYLSSLRNNESLFELYRLTLGCFQVIVGSLTSKRQGEILDLDAGNCLEPMVDPYIPGNEEIAYCMRYLARKSGERGVKETALIGITHNIAKMMWDFVAFHRQLAEMNLVPSKGQLLKQAHSRQLTFGNLTASTYNQILDTLCDYFETPIIELNGVMHRYYVRQHPLRRFCALAFYHTDKHGRIEVIQHLLGHSDPEHVFHYISDSLPGAVLLEAKAQRITEELLSGIDGIEGLNAVRSYLMDQFQGSDILLKTTEEFKGDYEELVSMGAYNASETIDYFTRQSLVFQEVVKMLDCKLIDLQPEFFTYSDPIDGEVKTFNLFIKLSENLA